MRNNRLKKMFAFIMCASILAADGGSIYHNNLSVNMVKAEEGLQSTQDAGYHFVQDGTQRINGVMNSSSEPGNTTSETVSGSTTQQEVTTAQDDKTTQSAVTTQCNTTGENATTQDAAKANQNEQLLSEITSSANQVTMNTTWKIAFRSSLTVAQMKESKLTLFYQCDTDSSKMEVNAFYKTESNRFEGEFSITPDMTKGQYVLYKISYVNAVTDQEVTYPITDTSVSSFQKTDDAQQKDVAKEISLSAEKIQIRENATRKLTAQILPETAQDVGLEWKSSKPSVASVDENGVVTGKSKGSATITVTTTDGSNISASCEVKVSDTLVIVLDPGHGNKDLGAINYSKKLYERNVNLEIAKACRDYLEKYEGVAVYLTREKNSGFLGLDERTKFAKACDADVFISLHNNASVSKRATGAEVYVTRSTYKARYNKEMTALGKKILNNLGNCGIKKRGVYTRKSAYLKYPFDGSRADYYAVIRGSINRDIPAMIVEHAYIDSSDYRFLNSKSKTKKLGEADAKAIASYYKLTKRTDKTSEIEVSGIKLNCNETYLKLKKNKSYQLKATVVPTNAADKGVTYSSNKPGVVTTTAKGKLRAVKKGTVVITCTADDNGGMTRKLTVKVQ